YRARLYGRRSAEGERGFLFLRHRHRLSHRRNQRQKNRQRQGRTDNLQDTRPLPRLCGRQKGQTDSVGPEMSRLPKPRAVVFDWDDTIVDNWLSAFKALNTTLVHMGAEAWSEDEARRRSGPSARDLFTGLFGE